VRDRRRGSHLVPVFRPGRFAVWWWFVTLLGGWLVVRAFAGIEVAEVVPLGPAYGLVLGFVILAELRPVIASTAHDPDGVSLSTAFVFAILLYWGLDLALVTVVLATLVGEVSRRKRLYAAAFNVAQFALAFGAAALVLALWGWTPTPTLPAALQPVDLLVVVVAALAYHVTNLTVVGTAIGLAEQRPVRTAITEEFGYYTVTALAGLALAPLIVVVLERHWGFLPLLVLPLVTLWATARMSVDRELRARRDDLTGVANRSGLAEQLARRVAALDDEGAGRLALVVLDLDDFKEVNDTLGHPTGDDLLRAVAGRLLVEVRGTDVVARLGGDEFALLVEVAGAEEARQLVERVAAHLREPFDIEGIRLEVELSAGIAMIPDHGRRFDELLRRADTAMYQAKGDGEVVVVFHAELDAQMPVRLQLLADLRRGVDAGEIEVHYQPQLALADGRLVGMEGLVRWRHPRRGLLSPASFLPLAERTATMRQVTATVLPQVLAQQAVWRDRGFVVPVAVNVTLHDLADGALVDQIVAGLRAHDLPPGGLRLELAEQALAGDPTRVVAALARLAAIGVELSLDDFGTGHASLTRLKRVPVEEVKIDRQFVASVDRRAEDVAIVRSVVTLAQGLGLRTVAEGVETAEVHRVVTGLGCDVVQGWFLAPAMAAEELGVWLRTHDPDTDREAVHGR
jgi:diguanylate cyclase (GGDEF)-like protein